MASDKISDVSSILESIKNRIDNYETLDYQARIKKIKEIYDTNQKSQQQPKKYGIITQPAAKIYLNTIAKYNSTITNSKTPSADIARESVFEHFAKYGNTEAPNIKEELTVNSNLYLENYKDEFKNGNNIYDVEIILHNSLGEKKDDKEYTLLPNNIILKNKDENELDKKSKDVQTNLFNKLNKFKIIYDDIYLLKNNRIQFFELFRKLRDDTNDDGFRNKFLEFIYNINKKNQYPEKKRNDLINAIPNLDLIKTYDNIFKLQINVASLDISGLNLNNTPSTFILLLYTFCRAFYNLDIRCFTRECSIDKLDQQYSKNIFGHAEYTDLRSSKDYDPQEIKKSFNKSIYDVAKKFYFKENEEPEDNDVITLHNMYELLKKILIKENVILELIDTEEDKTFNYEILKTIQHNPDYIPLIKINKIEKKIIMHFDVELSKILNVQYVKFFLELKEDIKKPKVEFLPSYTDSSYPKNSNILITNKYKILETYLNASKFSRITDKRLFFLDNDYFIELMKHLKSIYNLKNDIVSKKDAEENLRYNINLIIKLFFKRSKQHSNNGVLLYPDQNTKYFINHISNINYNFEAKTTNNYKKHEGINFDKLSIDITQFDSGILENFNFEYYVQDLELNLKLKIKNINKETGTIEVKLSDNGLSRFPKEIQTKINEIFPSIQSSIPISKVNIKPTFDNLSTVNSSEKKTIFFNKKIYKLENINQDKSTVTLLDISKPLISELNYDQESYKVFMQLHLLDKAKPITYKRRIFSGNCKDSCANIDDTLNDIINPGNTGEKIKFFSDLFKRNKENVNIDELIDRKQGKGKKPQEKTQEKTQEKPLLKSDQKTGLNPDVKIEKPGSLKVDAKPLLKTENSTNMKIKGGSRKNLMKYHKITRKKKLHKRTLRRNIKINIKKSGNKSKKKLINKKKNRNRRKSNKKNKYRY